VLRVLRRGGRTLTGNPGLFLNGTQASDRSVGGECAYDSQYPVGPSGRRERIEEIVGTRLLRFALSISFVWGGGRLARNGTERGWRIRGFRWVLLGASLLTAGLGYLFAPATDPSWWRRGLR
jgi:hypothetical protein